MGIICHRYGFLCGQGEEPNQEQEVQNQSGE